MTDLERIETALGAMSAAPRSLRAYLRQPGPDFEALQEAEVDRIVDLLLTEDPNARARLRFSGVLRTWDNARDAPWADGTPRNTRARRSRIHALLQSGGILAKRIDDLLPFFPLEEPLIIAERHTDWYVPLPGVRDYYWQTYVRYLRERKEWSDAALLSLDNHTRAIVECLADPEAESAYATRGLVMGYVQSGKTANFTGVVARAADAGYRLIIVLAGTWNILRNQTQRRLDKELLGKELLVNDEAYMDNVPADWDDFLEHGGNPAEAGHYLWQRLTRPDIDFQRLRTAIDTLEFDRRNMAAPVYDPSNLHELPAKLLVVKKHAGVLTSLVRDLKLLRTKLTDLPTLIIDDESDQAGINTVDPSRSLSGRKARSATNARIVELLGLFPRGQYVGYTATPYANALIDPDDPEDLFPKDFILPLDRPAAYMGIADFFDPTTAYADLDKEDFTQPEIAFIRRVENSAGNDDEDLKQALRSYVVAGAVKLYRGKQDRRRYPHEYFKHHTMLVHTSHLRGEMAQNAQRLEGLWYQCGFNTPGGLRALETVWENDFRKVSRAIGNELMPASFGALADHLSETISRVERGGRVYLVVNSDSPDAPDFSAAPVWKIIVGGNKMSRGYTVEGLTVSYYRRVAKTADTLMQMGRWFGFRPGYKDLVRVFLGVKEGRVGRDDLVSLFKEVCRMEEAFREEIKRYVRTPGQPVITPRQIPPLIALSGNLPPTARNRMFNAVLARKNFGGQRSMPTLAPITTRLVQRNLEVTEELLACGRSIGEIELSGTLDGRKALSVPAHVWTVQVEDIARFLQAYRWLESDYGNNERPKEIDLQVKFLRQANHGITGWHIIAPKRGESFGVPWTVEGIGILSVKQRSRNGQRGFQVIGEPAHRLIAEFVSGIGDGPRRLEAPNKRLSALKQGKHGVMLLYPIRENERDPASIGFELFVPPNDLPYAVGFTVRRAADAAAVVTRA